MVWLNGFICELAHKEKHTATASETKSRTGKRVITVFVRTEQKKQIFVLSQATTRGVFLVRGDTGGGGDGNGTEVLKFAI